MRSDIYKKLLHDVEEHLNNHKFGDIAIGYVNLILYGMQDEKDKIIYLKSILKDKNGKRGKLLDSVEEETEIVQRHFEDMDP